MRVTKVVHVRNSVSVLSVVGGCYISVPTTVDCAKYGKSVVNVMPSKSEIGGLVGATVAAI